ncbi:MAG TPA: DNA cytosine methyltransferase [Gaiellaceae bacterium]|nr:DNA cytosine methyltransferase [Gaiellaceae bacterium]
MHEAWNLVVVERRPAVVDLFAGAGGLSLGFTAAGFEVLCAADNTPAAVETYNANLGPHATVLDLAGEVTLPDCDVIAGGPPCQSFSSAGRRRDDDHRGTLVRRFAEMIVRHRPRAFVFENVEGFLTAGGGSRVLELLEPIIEAGYRVHLRKINAANYGVPQHRKRVLAIGGLGWEPTFPAPTHSAFGAPGARRVASHLPLTPTLGEALEGLGRPSERPPGDPPDHFARPLRDLDRVRAEAMKQGQTMRDLPEELWHESYRRRAFRRVMDGTPTERRGGAPAGLRRLRVDAPSKAITSGARSEFLHPTEHRLLTLRECARIQTFPDSFRFVGTASERALLIGNAVPPRLARAVADSLLADLQEARSDNNAGALLSFVPTLADAMSPALARTTELVARRFAAPSETGEALRLWA